MLPFVSLISTSYTITLKKPKHTVEEGVMLDPRHSLRLPTNAALGGSTRDMKEQSMSIISDRKESVREARMLTERFRKAVTTAIISHRLETAVTDSSRKSKQRQLSPFSSVTIYQSVRALLDPVRHQHLLGNDDKLAAGGKNQRRGSVTSTPKTTSRTDGGLTSPTHPTIPQDDAVSVDVLSDDDDEVDVTPLDSAGHHQQEKVHLPNGREVAMLPKELAVTFQNVARQRLRLFLYPRVLLVRYKRMLQAQRAIAAQAAAQISVDFLKKVKIFSEWPSDALNMAHAELDFRYCEPGTYIRFAGEKVALDGVLILAHGSIDILRRVNQLEKRLTPSNTAVLSSVSSPHVFNEYCFLTDEPSARTMRAAAKCDMYYLRKATFERCLAMLPPAVRHAVHAQAAAKRQRSIMEFYPLYPHTMRQQCRSFQRCSTSVLESVIGLLKSVAIAPNQSIIRNREMPASVLFLRRGRVAHLRMIKGELMHIRNFIAPQTFFENCIVERTEFPDMLRAATECDFLSLNLDDLHQLMALHPQERANLLESSRGERMQSLSQQQVTFRPLVYQIPLLRTVCDVEELNTITYLFESKVYPAMSIIASKSECCDRIIVLTKGNVSFGVKGKWAIGEAVGYTALVKHRWACSAVAIDNCETLELRADLLRAFMQDSGKLELAINIVEALLFPLKFEIESRERFLESEGVHVGEDVKRLHRSGRLLVPRRALQIEMAPLSTPSKRLEHLVDKVRDDVAALFTPVMHPVSSATTRSQSEQGFAQISKPDDFGVDFCVPSGTFVPHLTKEDREASVIKALAAQKRCPFRKMVHVTPFLLVKQR